MLSPLTTMYTSCISATFKKKPGKGVRHDLTYLDTYVSNPGLSPIQVPSAGSPTEVSHTAPNDVYRVP